MNEYKKDLLKFFRLIVSKDEMSNHIDINHNWRLCAYAKDRMGLEPLEGLSSNTVAFLDSMRELSWEKDPESIIEGLKNLEQELLQNNISGEETSKAFEILEEYKKRECDICNETRVLNVVLDVDTKEAICEDCSINEAEAAQEAKLEAFYGSDQPQTLREKQEEARKLK